MGEMGVRFRCLTITVPCLSLSLMFSFSFFIYVSIFLLFFVLDVAQNYVTGVGDEFVIIGNDVLMKCAVPSFAVDFVILTGWVISEDIEIVADSNQNGN